MSESPSTQALSTSHADLITSLAFSSSSPSLLASTSLDGCIRIHARTPIRSRDDQATSANGRSTGLNGHAASGDAIADRDVDEDGASGPAGATSAAEWTEIGGCKANDGPVWRAIWGPREYGTSVLVSIAGSIVNIWETQMHADDGRRLELTPKATLVEARGSLRDIAFGPSEFGMKLASLAADSHLRIYECLDPSSSGLAAWSLLEDIDLLPLPNTYYSPSNSTHGSQANSQQTQLIKGFDDGRLGPAPASSLQGGHPSTLPTSGGDRNAGRIESSGAWAIAYCQEAWWGECVAVSAGSDGLVRIIHFSPPSYWSQLVVLSPPASPTTSPISTIAWAPSCGRSYHLIASGSRDGCVRIWRLTPGSDAGDPWEATIAAEIKDHMDGSSGGVGRVDWNVTGTVLSTAGCDGVVRLWKASYSGEWRCLSNISVESTDENSTNRTRR